MNPILKSIIEKPRKDFQQLSSGRNIPARVLDEIREERNADLEKIMDIQAVMITGMEAIEQGRDTYYEMPEAVYQACRRKLPAFDDREEIRYLPQPDHKAYLQFGMRSLSLV